MLQSTERDLQYGYVERNNIMSLLVMKFAKGVWLQIPLRCECLARTLGRDWLVSTPLTFFKGWLYDGAGMVRGTITVTVP